MTSSASRIALGLLGVLLARPGFAAPQPLIAPNTPRISTPAREQLQNLKARLGTLKAQPQNFGDVYRGSPAISISNPTAFGADNGTFFISANYSERIRINNLNDGGLGLGVGLLNAQQSVGVELTYALNTLGRNVPLGNGGINVKFHRRFEDDWAAAIGFNGLLKISTDSGRNDIDQAAYAIVSKVFRTQDDIAEPFSRIAVSAGIGGGGFRPIPDIARNRNSTAIFGSVSARISEQMSFITEWTGQDLAVGVSLVPFPNLGWVITPAFRDLAGEGLTGARFVLGTSFAFKF